MRFEDTTWAWRRDIPLRYLLVGQEWDGGQELWAKCGDAAGLFVDPVPVRETLTFVTCAPTGRLLKAVERSAREPVRLGHLAVTVDFPDDHPDSWGGYWCHYWQLDEAVVLGSRPAATDPRLLDVLVEAEVTGPAEPMYRPGPVIEPEDCEVRVQNGTGAVIGKCRRIAGLYDDSRPGPDPAPPIRLVGVEPGAPLLDRLVRPTTPGSEVELWVLDHTGRVIHSEDGLFLDIEGTRPSALGGALVDIALGRALPYPPGSAAHAVWEEWFTGGSPTAPGRWARFPTAGRQEWLRLCAPGLGDVPAGDTRRLDGRHVTDVPGLKCALGEAVIGPGHRFDLCWGMLQGCSCGGDTLPGGPFTLVWHDSEVARRALASDLGVDPTGELDFFEATLKYLRRLGITVVLR
ncbi:hypothetical protein [Kitasatospora sp. NPDC093806]|uniref:hypothetical protein n=1 Tax=Kitasatospora sp. NPDC093806 TaxID=3155075 RepID=UPI0034401A1F